MMHTLQAVLNSVLQHFSSPDAQHNDHLILVQIVGESDPQPEYVRAIMEKTGGMPLYIEMIVEFFHRRSGGAGQQGGDVADIVNSMNFQQVC